MQRRWAPRVPVAKDHAIRAATIDGEPWFVAIDVCRALGMVPGQSGVGRYLTSLAADERQVIKRTPEPFGGLRVFFSGTEAALTLISESGLYRLVMLCDKTNARPFQDWVTKEVLPSIRKTGSYALTANYVGL